MIGELPEVMHLSSQTYVGLRFLVASSIATIIIIKPLICPANFVAYLSSLYVALIPSHPSDQNNSVKNQIYC